MKVVKCEKDHFYDADKYEICPHCKNGLKKYKKEEYEDLDYGFVGNNTDFITKSAVFSKIEDDQKTVLLVDDQQTVLLEDDPDKTELIIQ